MNQAHAVRLDHFLASYADRGTWIPVALGHSVLDDLLSQPFAREGGLELQDVEIDLSSGQARLRSGSRMSPEGVADLARLLIAGTADRFAPEKAWPALYALEEAKTWTPEAAAHQLRSLCRRYLPPPAQGEELVHAWRGRRGGEATSDWQHLPTEIGMSKNDTVPNIPPALDIEALTGIPEPCSEAALSFDPPAAPPLEQAPEAGPSDALSSSAVEAVPSSNPQPPTVAARPVRRSQRPVVRHQLPRSDRPVTLTSAPAARRSARASRDGDDIAFLGDERSWLMWLGVLLALTGVMYLLFFR